MKDLLFSYFLIIRPINCFITFLTVFFGGIIISNYKIDFNILLLAAISASLITAAGNVINDIFDIDLDKIVHPNRPLPSKKINIEQARIFYLLLNIFALLLLSQTFLILFIIGFFVIIILYLYARSLKKIFLVGNFLVAFLTGLTFIFAGITVNSLSNSFIPAVFAFLINFIREIVKDTEDISGDIKYGIKSLPIALGLKKTKIVIIILIVFLILFSIYPFAAGIYNIEYFVFIMVTVNPILVFVGKLFFDDQSNMKLSLVSLLLKLNMFLGLIAISLNKWKI